MSENERPIPALWFDREGCGPSELALRLHPFPAELDGKIPASLGLRVLAGSPEGRGPILYAAAIALVNSGFVLYPVQVAELHSQLGRWLEVNPPNEAPPPPAAVAVAAVVGAPSAALVFGRGGDALLDVAEDDDEPQGVAELDLRHLKALRNTVAEVLAMNLANLPEWTPPLEIGGACRHDAGHTSADLEEALAALDNEIRTRLAAEVSGRRNLPPEN